MVRFDRCRCGNEKFPSPVGRESCESLASPRRRHSHRPSSDDLGFVVVTHPFHPLIGQRLEVLYVKRRGADEVFVCAGGVGGQVTLSRSWTDRGPPARSQRLSVEGLSDLVAATRAIGGG